MAKSSKKDKAKSLSLGNLYSQEAVSALVWNLTRLPDSDEILRKAGISRHRLSILLSDDEIGQACETRQDAILAEPFRIEPSDTEQSLFLYQQILEWHNEIVSGAHSSLFYGYSVLEAVYAQKDRYIGLGWIGEKPMEWFEPKNDGRLIYRQDANGIGQEVDQQLKFFLTRRKPTYKQPYGEALLAKLYWPWHFKSNGLKFWAKFLERFGTPILLGKTDGDTNALAQAMLSAHNQAVLSIDKEDEVEVLATGGNGAGQSFEVFNREMQRSVQKLILGQTLTSGTDGTGSRALGEVHDNVRKDKLKSDLRLITPTLQAVVNALCILNGFEPHKIIVGDEKSLEADRAERDAKLSQAGVKLSKQYFMDNYGLREEDIEVQQSVVQPTFTALPPKAFSFAATSKKLSSEQQELEELANEQKQFTLLDQKQIKELIADVETPEQLQSKLIGMLGDVPVSQFSAMLNQALYAAEVLGYGTASEGK